MIENTPTTQNEDSIENRQSGMEGLAVAVIEMAVKDLESAGPNKTSAIRFFKNCPELLEFWLSAATHDGKHNIDFNLAKKKLYEQAEKAAKAPAHKKKNITQNKKLVNALNNQRTR